MTTKFLRRAAIVAACVLAVGALPAAAVTNDPLYGDQWALPQVGAPRAWQGASGEGVVVAIVDTGVDLTHDDLASKLVEGKDFVSGGQPQDEHGHGTHVAGIAAAATNNGIGIAGMAPAARIMPVRVLDEEGQGTASTVAEGVRWAVDNGAHIVNLSLGSLDQPLRGPAFGESLEYAWSQGAIPVVAAGNASFLLSSGYGQHPAIVVSATDPDDNQPEWASGVGEAEWGMAAPGGGGMLSAQESDIMSTYVGNQYKYERGTSMAAPQVSGAAALLRSMGLGQQRNVEILLETAEDVGPYRDTGHGRLDTGRAIEKAGAELHRQAQQSEQDPTTPRPQPEPAPQTDESPPASEEEPRQTERTPPPTPGSEEVEQDPADEGDDEADDAPAEEEEDVDDPDRKAPALTASDPDGGGGDGGGAGPIVAGAVGMLFAGLGGWLVLRRLGVGGG